MLRRLTALLLAFACVLTLALPAHETSDQVAVNDCCCGPDAPSTCGKRDCAPQPCAASATARASVATTEEQQAPAAKPAARVSRQAFAAFLAFFVSEKSVATSARTLFAARVVPAGSVALFQAHCSLLI